MIRPALFIDKPHTHHKKCQGLNFQMKRRGMCPCPTNHMLIQKVHSTNLGTNTAVELQAIFFVIPNTSVSLSGTSGLTFHNVRRARRGLCRPQTPDVAKFLTT